MTQRWKDSLDPKDLMLQEKLKSVTSKESNAFLNVVLKNFYPHWIYDPQFLEVFRYKAMLRMVPEGMGKCSKCHKHLLDDYGEHFMKCSQLGRGAPHKAVQTATLRVLHEEFGLDLGLSATPTPFLSEFRRESPQEHPAKVGKKEARTQADMRIYEQNMNQLTIIDIVTCAMRTPSNLAEVGTTVSEGEKAKNLVYDQNYVFQGRVKFIPFAIDTHGRWGEAFKKFVEELCLRKAEGHQHSQVYALAMANVRRKISIAHARAVGSRLLIGKQACLKYYDVSMSR